jgi:beta-glucosidase
MEGISMTRNIDKKAIIAAMTQEEKVSLLSGLDFWSTKSIERLGIGSFIMTDGPHGMRKQAGSSADSGFTDIVPATCFPTGAGLAATWNPDIIEKVGSAMGKEARAENVSILLGPAVNIKRSPLCGRNFEYLSEDPYLAGKLAAAHIRGIQSQGVGTSIKHFAVNNQEYFRMVVDAIIDERTLREIYLPAFEIAVKEASPWTVMCAYNRVNGTFCSENPHLLTDILRDDWNYDGVLITDWTACNDRVKGLLAGQDLEMPGNGGVNDRLVLAALESGSLDESVIDRALEHLLRLYERVAAVKGNTPVTADLDAHHRIAREAAAESVVLLKNENEILPIAADKKIALIGTFAEKPRYQGGGSSHINPARMDSLKEQLLSRFSNVQYAKGYNADSDVTDQILIDEACSIARNADVVIVCAGLIDLYESEGYDRKHMHLPQSHTDLIGALSKIHKHVVVILSNGSPVEMPWVNDVPAIIEAYLAGQGGAHAIAAVIAGEINPSGKLAESFPLCIEDTPCYLSFPGTRDRVEYREGVFVGYRHYDSVKRELLFPFGHGLSYTSFEYSSLSVTTQKPSADGTIVSVNLTVKNSGKRTGKEVVQLYVHECSPEVPRPEQELKGFFKIEIAPGVSKTVSLNLNFRSFAWFDESDGGWRMSGGDYEIRIGSSSRDIRLSGKVTLESFPKRKKRAWSDTDTLYDVQQYPEHSDVARKISDSYKERFKDDAEPGTPEALMLEAVKRESPLRGIAQFGGPKGASLLKEILDKLNAD